MVTVVISRPALLPGGMLAALAKLPSI